MKVLKVDNQSIAIYFNQQEIVVETVAQLQKDMSTFGIEITFSGNMHSVYNELHSQLVNAIHQIGISGTKIYSILYRIDISEKEIAQATADNPHYNQVEVLAHQMILRELKKVLTRRAIAGKM
ncbi:MAG: hypothetical protein IPI46_00430 [Bacteroidetes bacterium]|nr:hypothetical protein [Bacteroidota bacterium]